MNKKQVGGDIDKTTAMMLEIYGYSVEKVAEVWGISPFTVERRVRAIKDKEVVKYLKEQIKAFKEKRRFECIEEVFKTYEIAIKRDRSNLNKTMDLISLKCFNRSKCNGKVKHLIETAIMEISLLQKKRLRND